MSAQAQHTLASPARFAGVGVHTGKLATVTVSPAAAGTGVRFHRVDLHGPGAMLAATADAVCETRLGTVIGNGHGVTVATIEHLMATLSGLGVDNAVVEIDGPEMPIMDGSCEPLVRAIDRAGVRPLAAARRYMEILEPIAVDDGDKRAALVPSDRFELAFEIAFDDPAIGRQQVDLQVDETSFRRDLADSRTFGFLHEVETLRAAGLARGGSMDNVIVIDRGAVLNPQGLRRPDEFVRHKCLDAIGDLYLLGAPLLGRYEGRYAGHGLNNALTRAVLARPSAWRLVTQAAPLARAI